MPFAANSVPNYKDKGYTPDGNGLWTKVTSNLPKSLSQGDTFNFTVDFAIEDGTYKSGDEIVIGLPENVNIANYPKELMFEGKKVADVNLVKGSIVLTFNEFIENKSNVRGGLTFVGSFTEISENKENHTISVTINEQSFDLGKVNLKKPFDKAGAIPIYKWSRQSQNENKSLIANELTYTIFLNREGKYLANPQVNDEFSEPNKGKMALKRDSFVVKKGKYSNNLKYLIGEGSVVDSSTYDLKINDDLKGFSIEFSEPINENEGVSIEYKVELTDPKVGDVFYNSATLIDGPRTEKAPKEEIIYQFASANVTGDDRKIKIIKTDSENKPMSDVKFTLIDNENKEKSGTTDNDGTLIFNETIPGEYKLVETLPEGYELKEAPEGYSLDENNSIVITKDDFNKVNSNGELVLNLINYLKKPDQTEIKVKKEWKDSDNNSIDAPVNTVEVELYKDGKATGTKENLNKSNNWEATFKELPVSEKLDSEPYDYTVKEVGAEEGSIHLSGNWYRVSIAGNMKDGFTLVNKQSKTWTPMIPPTREIKVKKEWKGAAGTEAIAILKADGTEKQRIKLSAENGWQHTFKNLDTINKTGKEIKYEVDEEPISGYSKSIKLVEGVYVITNTKEVPPVPKKINVLVTKEWQDVDGNVTSNVRDSVEVVLYKDGKITNKKALLNASNGWTAIFDNLEYGIYDVREVGENNNIYTIGEKKYNVLYGGNQENGFRIINKEIPNDSKLVDFRVNKVWVNGEENRPTIKIQLFQNGEKYGIPVSLLNGQTTYTWKDLPLLDEKGRYYNYTVDEIGVPEGYKKSVNGSTIINTWQPPKEPETPEVPNTPDKPETPEVPNTPTIPVVPKEPNQPEPPKKRHPFGSPKTGITGLGIVAGLLATSTAGLIVLNKKKD